MPLLHRVFLVVFWWFSGLGFVTEKDQETCCHNWIYGHECDIWVYLKMGDGPNILGQMCQFSMRKWWSIAQFRGTMFSHRPSLGLMSGVWIAISQRSGNQLGGTFCLAERQYVEVSQNGSYRVTLWFDAATGFNGSFESSIPSDDRGDSYLIEARSDRNLGMQMYTCGFVRAVDGVWFQDSLPKRCAVDGWCQWMFSLQCSRWKSAYFCLNTFLGMSKSNLQCFTLQRIRRLGAISRYLKPLTILEL